MNPKPGRDVYPLPPLALSMHHENVMWRTAAEVLGVMCVFLLGWALWMQWHT
jgi:hypothetical protein